MRRTHLPLRALATVVVAGILIPSVGRAQTVRVASTPAIARALEEQANTALSEQSRYERAAELFVQAASIRPDTDPKAVGDLLTAAGSFFAVGQPTRARELYVQAGDRALGMGDVLRAAHGYLRAAIIANVQRDPVRDQLIERADRLAASPLLTASERKSILGQFQQPLQVAEHR